MADLDITVQCSRSLTDPDVPCREENLTREETQWSLSVEETAVVLVDCWDVHPLDSHEERSGQISREKILPAVQACRKAGVTVVHAPSPPQAAKYPLWTKYPN